MATRRLSFSYVLKQNKNDNSTAFGKWFAEAYSPSQTLSLKGLCERVAMDQSVFTPEIARGVIDKLTTDMNELLMSATSVKWDGLGTFRPTVESTGVNSPEDYNVNTNVMGIHIRFVPVNDKGEELTSRKFADSLVFSLFGKKTTTKVEKPNHKKAWKGNVQVAATAAALRNLPLIQKVDDEAPDGTFKTTGSTFTFSGGKEGLTYTLKRKGEGTAVTTLGTQVNQYGGEFSITTSAQAADATMREVYVEWDEKGKTHTISLGKYTIVAGE